MFILGYVFIDIIAFFKDKSKNPYRTLFSYFLSDSIFNILSTCPFARIFFHDSRISPEFLSIKKVDRISPV